MPVTSTRADFKFIDVTALEDSELSTNGNYKQDLSLFKTETKQADYGSLELNQFVLDESKTIYNSSVTDIAYWSSRISDDNCTFDVNPKITVVFDENHTSAGITIKFADDYPEEIKITWYTLNNEKIISKSFFPDDIEYACRNQVVNYGRLEIECVKTRLPNRRYKVQWVEYGIRIHWKDNVIQTAKVHEEVDKSSSKLAINTCDIAIVDEAYDFDIANPDGAWLSVQKTQEVTIIETKDGVDIPCGTFFIDKKSFANNIASFSMIDRIGLMDNYEYERGEIYTQKKAGEILEDIFEVSKVEKYSIQNDLYDIELTGYLKIMSCREALQMVCFAIGAIADDSRSDTVKIYKPSKYIKYYIGVDRKFNGETAVELEKYISGVSITCSTYNLSDKTDDKIYKDILFVGDNKIQFKKPYLPSSIQVSAGTIKEVSTNYIVVTMAAEGECNITGQKYEDSEFTYTINDENVEAGETENIKEHGTITLYNMKSLKQKAEALKEFYQLRKMLKMKFLINTEAVGEWMSVSDKSDHQFLTFIESQDIDLTGGFISTASCRGYTGINTNYYYTGNELIMPDKEII